MNVNYDTLNEWLKEDSKYFKSDEQEKKDYIEFILLALYTELDYFLHNRFKYRKFEDNKIKNKQELNKLKKSLEFVNNTIPKYEFILRTERSKNQSIKFFKEFENIQHEITEYQERTQKLLTTLQEYELKNPTRKEFVNFYSRKNKDIRIVRDVIIKYLCVITQICFGVRYKNKYHLFYKILKILTNDERINQWGEYDYLGIRDIVIKNVDIEKDKTRLKICFQGLLEKTLLLERDRESFDKLKEFHYDSQLIDRYEKFIFNNIFFDKYAQFKK